MKETAVGELYRLTFPNGKSYVGITKTTSDLRFRGHGTSAINGPQLLYRAWRKHGAPLLTVLAILENSQLAFMEQRAITAFKTLTPNGYNSTPGGDFNPMHVPEIAAKLRGRTISDITRRKHAESNRKRVLSASTKEKLRIRSLGNRNCIGIKHSDEARAKMAVAQRLRFLDPNEGLKRNAGADAYWSKPENKLAHSQKIKQLWRDPKTREKMMGKRKRKYEPACGS